MRKMNMAVLPFTMRASGLAKAWYSSYYKTVPSLMRSTSTKNWHYYQSYSNSLLFLSYNETALHFASRSGKKRVVQLLINYGASLDADGPDGTAEQEAIKAGHMEIADFLRSTLPFKSPLDVITANGNCCFLDSFEVTVIVGSSEWGRGESNRGVWAYHLKVRQFSISRVQPKKETFQTKK